MFRCFVHCFFAATCVQLLPSWKYVSGGYHNQSPVQWQEWECDCAAIVLWHAEMGAEVRDANDRWDHMGDANEMPLRRSSDHPLWMRCGAVVQRCCKWKQRLDEVRCSWTRWDEVRDVSLQVWSASEINLTKEIHKHRRRKIPQLHNGYFVTPTNEHNMLTKYQLSLQMNLGQRPAVFGSLSPQTSELADPVTFRKSSQCHSSQAALHVVGECKSVDEPCRRHVETTKNCIKVRSGKHHSECRQMWQAYASIAA